MTLDNAGKDNDLHREDHIFLQYPFILAPHSITSSICYFDVYF